MRKALILDPQITTATTVSVAAILVAHIDLTLLMESNRFNHIIISSLLAYGVTFFFDQKDHKLLPIITTVMGLGLFKEFFDPHFDLVDILANAIGCFAGLLLKAVLATKSERILCSHKSN